MNATLSPELASAPAVTQGIVSNEQRAYAASFPTTPASDRLQELLKDAQGEDEIAIVSRLLCEGNAGNAESLELAREYYARDLENIKYFGSLGAMSRGWIMQLNPDIDPFTKEYALRNADALEVELRRRGDSPLIRMMTDRLMTAYVAAGVNDFWTTKKFQTDGLTAERMAAQESAERRILIALQSLELAERLEKQNPPSKSRGKAAS